MNEKEHNCLDPDGTREHIEKYGLSVIRLYPTSYLPSFAYSVGLTETYQHPEIICFGLKPDLLHEIIDDVAEIIRKEGAVKANEEYRNIFRKSRAIFLEVDPRNMADYFGVALSYYKSIPISGLQLVWTDRNDKFPWEESFEEEFRNMQPLLDRNADFKFREAKNLGVFTSRQWLEEKAPILYVVHDEDGDWQFLTEEVDFDNPKLVALEQMILRDKSLNEVFNLDYGEEAERKFPGDKWIRRKRKE